MYDKPEISLTMWTPGVSDNYLDDIEDEKGLELHQSNFDEFARGDSSYPSDVAVAIATLFGNHGNNTFYLSRLDCDTALICNDGQLSRNIKTDLSYKEAGRLIELLKNVDVKKTEIIGGTD